MKSDTERELQWNFRFLEKQIKMNRAVGRKGEQKKTVIRVIVFLCKDRGRGGDPREPFHNK